MGKIIFIEPPRLLSVMCRHKLPPSFLVVAIAAVVILAAAESAVGIQFYLWKEECFSQKVEEVGDIVRVSFVVIRRKSKLHASTAGIDLVVKGPHGEQVHDDRGKKTEHFEFVAQKKGIYKFCFTSNAGYTEMVDFNIAINHEEHLEPAKNEQLAGVQKHIARLSKWLEAVEFKQRWLIADQHRLEETNRATNFWAIIKVAVESVALIASSALQVYLLKRLFKRKVGE